jgi:hypothetical protein
MQKLIPSYGSKDVRDFISLHRDGLLNLEPGFQRKSVWSVNDRRKLIMSILEGYPVPSVFFYKSTNSRGTLKYDVLDGKQRLESILMFLGESGFRNNKFSVAASFVEGEKDNWDWKKLKRKGYESSVTGYKMQTVEVSGDLSDIIDLFVRINSTGKRLTSQEKRHAKYYSSDFLKTAGKLGDRYASFVQESGILSATHIARMKHVELICELLASIHAGGLINKKTTLDKIIGGERIDARSLRRCATEFVTIINRVKKMFPLLKTTRFKHSAEFYSLFILIWEFDRDKMILTDSRRNKQAQKLLTWLSNGVDELRGQLNKGKGTRPDQQLFQQYLFTTRGDSDSSTTRKRRADVLHKLLYGIFEKKDEKRTFSPEQRRLIWNSDSTRKCVKCKRGLTWENFTIDHVKPYALGGPSVLKNASLMCRSCNSSKGKQI